MFHKYIHCELNLFEGALNPTCCAETDSSFEGRVPIVKGMLYIRVSLHYNDDVAHHSLERERMESNRIELNSWNRTVAGFRIQASLIMFLAKEHSEATKRHAANTWICVNVFRCVLTFLLLDKQSPSSAGWFEACQNKIKDHLSSWMPAFPSSHLKEKATQLQRAQTDLWLRQMLRVLTGRVKATWGDLTRLNREW